MGGLFCPRCGKQDVSTVEQKLSLPAGEIDFPEYFCTSCKSRYYFREDVLSYLNALTRKPMPEPAKETTVAEET